MTHLPVTVISTNHILPSSFQIRLPLDGLSPRKPRLFLLNAVSGWSMGGAYPHHSPSHRWRHQQRPPCCLGSCCLAAKSALSVVEAGTWFLCCADLFWMIFCLLIVCVCWPQDGPKVVRRFYFGVVRFDPFGIFTPHLWMLFAGKE